MRHAKNGCANNRRFNSAGKVILAAIVHHHDATIPTIGHHNDGTISKQQQQVNNNATSQQPIQEPIARKKSWGLLGGGGNENRRTKRNQSEEGEEETSGLPSNDYKLSSKFSKFLFHSKRKQHQQATTSRETNSKTTTLIDNAYSKHRPCPVESNESNQQQQQPPKCLGHKGELLHSKNSDHSTLRHPKLEQTNHIITSATTSDIALSNKPTAAAAASEQVIEFKFDLIVDHHHQENDGDENRPGSGEQVRADAGAADPMARRHQDEKEEEDVRMDVEKCKLNDNVNELVESFVLDSNDVCLMSIGGQQQQNWNEHPEGPANEFEYLNKLTMHTLAYSYKLLKSGQQQQQQQQRQTLASANSEKQSSSSPSDAELMSLAESSMVAAAPGEQQQQQPKGSIAGEANTCSIEFSATLFLGSSSELSFESRDPMGDDPAISGLIPQAIGLKWPPTLHQPADGFSIVDLLANNSETALHTTGNKMDNGHEDDDTKISPQTRCPSVAIDCSSITEALATLGRVRDQLNRLRQTKGFCMLTSRKLLIISLKLKQRINGGIFSNRMCLIDFKPNEFHELHPIFESIFNGQALAHLKRQKVHLQSLESRLSRNNVCSSSSLSLSLSDNDNDNDDDVSVDHQQTNKQHHQVASQNKLLQAEWLLYKQLSSALIRTLLIVHVHKLESLPEPNGIEVAQQQDMKSTDVYRKKLMDNNLLLLEFARSIQRASCIRLKRRKRHLRSHLASSNVSVNSNISATTATNELSSSPLRLNSSSSSNTNHHHHHHGHHSSIYRNHHHAKEQQPGSLGLSSGRKASLDMNLALSRHYNRHNHHLNNNNNGTSPRHLTQYRFHTLQRRPDATESSSLSTSSGSQRTTQQHIRSVRSSRSANRKLGYKEQQDSGCNNLSSPMNNFSDSDSVTSANLNSCSSSSYNRCQQHVLASSSNSKRSTNRSSNRDLFEDPRWSSRQRTSRKTMMMMMTQQQQQREQKQQHRGLLEPSNRSCSPGPIELSSMKCLTSPKRHRTSSSVCRGATATAAARGMNHHETSMASRASSVIQIDCHPNATVKHRASSGTLLASTGGLETGVGYKTPVVQQQINSAIDADKNKTDFDLDFDVNADDISDICSVIAEPPKQLKLEEFMNQLSSIIAPISNNTVSSLMAVDSSQQIAEAEVGERAKRIDSLARTRRRKDAGEEMILCPNGYDDRDGMVMMRKNFSRQLETHCLGPADGEQGRLQLLADRNPTTGSLKRNGNCVTTAADEDDEDCKSHSSILEHLSSLALESNTKLNNRHQLKQDYPFHHHYNNQQHSSIYPTCPSDDDPRPPPVDYQKSDSILLQTTQPDYLTSHTFLLENATDQWPEVNDAIGYGQDKSPTGHLQRLLNSSSQFRRTSNSRVTVRDPSSIEDQLKALSIGCQGVNADSTRPSSGAFVSSSSSSNESSCSSSSTSGPVTSTDGDKLTDLGQIKTASMFRGPAGISSQRDLYASVINRNQHQNVKT